MAHILLIEDDPSQVRLVERWLSDHDVVAARDGEEADALAARWDLVISDVHVPGRDGLELTRSRGHLGPPTLIITSDTEFDVALGAIKAGAADLLAKPFGRDALRSSVDKLLAARPRRKRVLALGAHPDDVEIGVGGTLARHHAAGDEVAILTLSRGAAGGETDLRENEARAAAAILGAQLFLDDLPDTRISHGPETIDAIERVVRTFRPDVVYTHSANDRHQDHRAVHEATRIAARNVASVFCYQSPSTTIDFRPARFVDVGQVLGIKLAALDAYRTQAGRTYLQPAQIEASAAYWGRFAQYARVEPLEILRDATTA